MEGLHVGGVLEMCVHVHVSRWVPVQGMGSLYVEGLHVGGVEMCVHVHVSRWIPVHPR